MMGCKNHQPQIPSFDATLSELVQQAFRDQELNPKCSADIRHVARMAKMTTITIHRWIDGTTLRVQNPTLNRFMMALDIQSPLKEQLELKARSNRRQPKRVFSNKKRDQM